MGYQNTFIVIADDCPDNSGTPPPLLGNKTTKAGIEYELLTAAPYTYNHDDLNYAVYCRQQSSAGKTPADREEYLSKGRPCLRASALTKRYGWGAHYDEYQRIAIYPAGGATYRSYSSNGEINKVIKAMRNKRT